MTLDGVWNLEPVSTVAVRWTKYSGFLMILHKEITFSRLFLVSWFGFLIGPQWLPGIV